MYWLYVDLKQETNIKIITLLVIKNDTCRGEVSCQNVLYVGVYRKRVKNLFGTIANGNS